METGQAMTDIRTRRDILRDWQLARTVCSRKLNKGFSSEFFAAYSERYTSECDTKNEDNSPNVISTSAPENRD